MDQRVIASGHRYPSKCSACVLRDLMARSDVPLADIATFHTVIGQVRLGRKEWLHSAGAAASSMYCVRAGLIKLVRYSASGDQRVVRLVHTGGVVGLEALFSPTYEHTAIAVNEVTACRVPTEYVRNMAATNGRLQHRLLEYSQKTLQETEGWLTELAGGSSSALQRLTRLLLRLREDKQDKIHCMSLEDIGAILGITPETACRCISALTSKGLLTKVGRRYFRADIAGLELAANVSEE